MSWLFQPLLLASAQQQTIVLGQASQTLTFSQTATGVKPREGSATQVLTFTFSATGELGEIEEVVGTLTSPTSILESRLRAEVYKAFKGKLLNGVLRRATLGSVDSYGDPTKTHTTYTLQGIVDLYSEFYKVQAGIPDSDVKLLIIAGSLSVTPRKDDQVKFRDTWYQVRKVDTDPALATWTLQSFVIENPQV